MRQIFAVVACVWLGVGMGSGGTKQSAPPMPTRVVNLREFGWTPPPEESNREFFKDFSIEKLETLDDGVNLLSLGEDVIVVYHTVQNGRAWRTSPRVMEAFAVKAEDGTLLHKESWPTSLQKSSDDLLDCAGRLLPLNDGPIHRLYKSDTRAL
jgi:hypothetical protein